MGTLSTAAKLLVPFFAVTLMIASCGRTGLSVDRQRATGGGGGQPTCRLDGEACRWNWDCCNKDCNGTACDPTHCAEQGAGCGNPLSGGLSCADGGCQQPVCYPPGNVCVMDASCCSGICGPTGTCDPGCQNKGTACTKSSQCCENDCESGVCVGQGPA